MTTRRYIPEDSKLHTRSLENLKSYKWILPLNIGTTLIFILNLGHLLTAYLITGIKYNVIFLPDKVFDIYIYIYI
jgi:hypothetical protein